MDRQDVVIIGSGIIGLCCAYYLLKEGHPVVIIDRDGFGTGCFFHNTVLVSPSHIIPLAAPGIISKGIKWTFSNNSPIFIKPRLDYGLIRWLIHFRKKCTRQHVQNSYGILKKLNYLSLDLYRDLTRRVPAPFDFSGGTGTL